MKDRLEQVKDKTQNKNLKEAIEKKQEYINDHKVIKK